MKVFIFISLFLVITPKVWAFEEMVRCDGNNVIDLDDRGINGAAYQLVVRSDNEIRNLRNTVMSWRYDAQKGEIILPMRKNLSNRNEYISDADAYQGDGRVYYLKFSGTDLVVEAWRTTQPTGGIYVHRDLNPMAVVKFFSCGRR